MATRSCRRQKQTEKPSRVTGRLYQITVCLLGLGFGLLHRWHVSTIFENDLYFSRLSEIEREMTFRTEMGMYYSYYKIIVEAKDFTEGLGRLSRDNLSEYGSVIDARKKYSLLPEITAGFLYHCAKELDLLPKYDCWEVGRGVGVRPVMSCVGLGVPIYFYLEIVWLASACTAAVLFCYSTYLSDSMASGFVSVLLFFYNHDECTRVQWTPPLRESFAYPALLFQMYRITTFVRDGQRQRSQKRISDLLPMDIPVATAISLGSWQFSPFVFSTQIVALLILKWSRIISSSLYRCVCFLHASAILPVAVLTGSTSILFSLYFCLVVSSFAVSYLEKFTPHLNPKIETALEILLTLVLTKYSKTYVFASEDDSHVFNILRSKLTDYKDFHTMLYTCSSTFQFLQYKTFEVIILTLLLPTAILAGMLVLYYWYRSFKTKGFPLCIEAEVAYNGLQTGAFIVMAVLIMRLKLFMNPHLCIIAGLVCGRRYLEKVGLKGELMRGAVIALILAGMSYHGFERFREQRRSTGEYSNIEQEELFEWIMKSTPKEAVFAGKMSLMANLMLSTGRAIVNNPYYESKEMRDRTLKVYEVFSRKDAGSVYMTLRNLKVDYIVLERHLCLGIANLPPGCQLIDLWDTVDNGTAKAVGKQPLCPILYRGNAYPFKTAYMSENYVVLQLAYPYYVEIKSETPVPLCYQS